MCKFCDDNNIGNAIDLSKDSKQLTRNTSIDLDIWLFRGTDRTAKIENIVFLCGEEYLRADVEIKYCPMCGRKLKED